MKVVRWTDVTNVLGPTLPFTKTVYRHGSVEIARPENDEQTCISGLANGRLRRPHHLRVSMHNLALRFCP